MDVLGESTRGFFQGNSPDGSKVGHRRCVNSQEGQKKLGNGEKEQWGREGTKIRQGTPGLEVAELLRLQRLQQGSRNRRKKSETNPDLMAHKKHQMGLHRENTG